MTRDVVLKKCNGKIAIDPPLRRGMILIGFTSTPLSTGHETSLWNVEGTVHFHGPATLGNGSKIAVGKKGVLHLGDRFEITANSAISCFNEIKIGNHCLFSWDILLMDTDGHPLYDDDQKIINPDGNIIVGDKVWIGCRCVLLKNTQIADGCIIGAASLLNKPFTAPNSLIAGIPAKILKKRIRWQ